MDVHKTRANLVRAELASKPGEGQKGQRRKRLHRHSRRLRNILCRFDSRGLHCSYKVIGTGRGQQSQDMESRKHVVVQSSPRHFADDSLGFRLGRRNRRPCANKIQVPDHLHISIS